MRVFYNQRITVIKYKFNFIDTNYESYLLFTRYAIVSKNNLDGNKWSKNNIVEMNSKNPMKYVKSARVLSKRF